MPYQPFFQLTPPRPLTTDDALYVEHFYSIPERDLVELIEQANPLYDVLHEALDTYCETYPATTESMVLYAADMFLGSIKAVLRASAADA